MARLSNNTTFGKRTYISESQNPQKVYAIAYEGNVTEKSYFNGIADNKDELGINENIKVYPLNRADDDTQSHCTHILDLMNEYVKDYGHEGDEVWMVLDRDRQNNTQDQLLDCFSRAAQSGYHIALTNPTFELWLLLHIADLSNYSKEVLFENRKSGSRRFLDKEISDLLDGYNVKKRSLKPFMDRAKIERAIEQEQLICHNFPAILDNLGSNVGKLMSKILSKP